jgi:predicted membrane chloride channel (bestrophin family)
MRTTTPLSRYYNLNAGLESFAQCKKIVDTPFPYPYAQGITIMLILFTIAVPVQVCELVNNSFVAVVVSFFGVSIVAMVNRVATDLEEPFMEDTNDLPLLQLHTDFNEKIASLLMPQYWRTHWPHQKASNDPQTDVVSAGTALKQCAD